MTVAKGTLTTAEQAQTNRGTARTVGALFWVSNVTFMLGAVVLVEAVLGAPDYLAQVSANQTQLIAGVLLELVNGVAYVGIAALMFPIFKQRYEGLALGYFGFRIAEFVMQIAAGFGVFLLLGLSEGYLAAGAADAAAYETLGALLRDGRFWAFQMVSLTFGLGGLLFYTMLYQMNLVPRFISVWGLIGAAVVLANLVLDMLGVTLPNLGIIMLLNELFLGLWLIVKGFNPGEAAAR